MKEFRGRKLGTTNPFKAHWKPSLTICLTDGRKINVDDYIKNHLDEAIEIMLKEIL